MIDSFHKPLGRKIMATKKAKSAKYSVVVGTQRYTLSGGFLDEFDSEWNVEVEELRDFGGLVIPNRYWNTTEYLCSMEDVIDCLWEHINEHIREHAETNYQDVEVEVEVEDWELEDEGEDA
jgi:hypothetical protein